MKLANLVLFILILSLHAEAGKRKISQDLSQSAEAKVFHQYYECQRELKSDNDVRAQRNCADESIFQQAEPSRKERLAAWLTLGAQVHQIRNCTTEELQKVRGFPETTTKAVCFEFVLNEKETLGFAFFKESPAKKLGLYSIHYR